MRLTQVSGGTAAFLGLLFAGAALGAYWQFGKCDHCWRPARWKSRAVNIRGEYLGTSRWCEKHDPATVEKMKIEQFNRRAREGRGDTRPVWSRPLARVSPRW